MSHISSIMEALSNAAKLDQSPAVFAKLYSSLIFQKITHLTDQNFDQSDPAFMRHKYTRHVDDWAEAIEKIENPKEIIDLVLKDLDGWTTCRSVLKGYPKLFFEGPMETRLMNEGNTNPKGNARAAVLMRDDVLDIAIDRADQLLARYMEHYPDLVVKALLGKERAFETILPALKVTNLTALHEARNNDPSQTTARPIAADMDFDLF